MFSDRNVKMEIFIVPSLSSDFIKYLKDYSNKDFIDNDGVKSNVKIHIDMAKVENYLSSL